MTVVFVLAALAVVLAIGLLAVGRLGGLPAAPPDLAPDRLPQDRPLGPADVDGVRFDVGLRGYRMDEVDALLDRVAADLAARDAIIDRLRSGVPEEPPPADVAADAAAPEEVPDPTVAPLPPPD